MITLIFQPRALRPDVIMIKKFNDFMAANKADRLDTQYEIQAVANTNSGQITEARRLAYYRAMVARQLLIDTKIDPKFLRVIVVDSISDDPLDYVKIIAKP